MKNIICVKELTKCHCCNMKGFFCLTPSGGDFETCPCCGKDDFLNVAHGYYKPIKTHDFFTNEVKYTYPPTKYDFLQEDEYDNDMRNTFKFCDSCNIIFELGCMHSARGCTDNVYNCHFISKWKNKVTNEEYKGMPQFENSEDWFNNVNNVEVLEMYCPHNGNKCKNTTYEIKGTLCDTNITKK